MLGCYLVSVQFAEMPPAASNGDPLSLKERGNDAFKRGEMEEALRLYTEAIQIADKGQVTDTEAQFYHVPTNNIGTTRATPMAMSLVVISDGVQNLGCSKASFFPLF